MYHFAIHHANKTVVWSPLSHDFKATGTARCAVAIHLAYIIPDDCFEAHIGSCILCCQDCKCCLCFQEEH